MMHKKDNIKVDDMLYLLAEGVLGDEGVGYINGWLASGPEAVKYYCQFINDYVAIKHEVNSIIEMDNSLFGVSDEFDLELWSALADAEKIAPAVEIPKEQPQRELIQKVVYPPREKRKISKFNLFTLITSAAAILFVVLFLKFAPAKQYSVEVATLADQMNVQWGQSHPALASGSRLWTNESPYVLEKGIVKILYDEGVEVLIESPAKFEIERSGVYLEYGRLFSRVSESGLGFSVETQNSRFVDLGTEFGVKAEIDGSSELHVIKGKVQLFAGSKNNDKISQVLQEDVAVRFDAKSGQLKSVPIQKVAFVRDVSSQDGSVWRGQMEIDLADIVGGGNGFGTGRWGVSVNPDTGKMQDGFVCRNGVPVRGSGNYVAMETPEGVDGVFVPDGGQGTVVVSSAGHVFQECPDTSGKFCWDIYNGNAGEIGGESRHLLDGIEYGTAKHPGITVHSNTGITFDLNKIRSRAYMHSRRVVAFESKCGMLDRTRSVFPENKVQFWVLIDGEVRYESGKVDRLEATKQISIKLSNNDRFLTLIVDDAEENEKKSLGDDWAVFAEPVLKLK